MYQQAVELTAYTLQDSIRKIENQLFSLLVTGELKEWFDNIPIGEEVLIENAVYEGCDDNNIKTVLLAIKRMKLGLNRMVVLNKLDLKAIKRKAEEEKLKDNPFWRDDPFRT